ncbi:molybdate ABC transporter substrate-binding protein [Bacillus timonensis]|uniref:Molybdate ABC transporter substrate-binding protein n=1 Tax=Bacillus timonensis TaxID=1033734 RepID=A0A4S3PP64_9BACI|nr:molybdate ABC transporter substrate-binding protein [Bacillus timonensis]THE11064.1 molybdate ABC transporter substrate-binding protein [Bacillus timonensis]
MYRFIFLLILVLFLNACGSPEETENVKNAEITVSAAASMQNVLQELKKNFEEKHPTIDISFNFGASGALSQQISQGAPVDLFLSASLEKFNELRDNGLIHEKFQQNLIGNEIVLITPQNNKHIKSVEDLKKAKRISIGIPESVPAGAYAKEAIDNMGLWNTIENQLVLSKDVRQVLTYVETGNVDAGFVYKTDTQMSNQIQVITSVDSKYHSPIIYPIGVIKSSKHVKEATLFYEYLLSEEAITLFEEYGFTRIQ